MDYKGRVSGQAACREVVAEDGHQRVEGCKASLDAFRFCIRADSVLLAVSSTGHIAFKPNELVFKVRVHHPGEVSDLFCCLRPLKPVPRGTQKVNEKSYLQTGHVPELFLPEVVQVTSVAQVCATTSLQV